MGRRKSSPRAREALPKVEPVHLASGSGRWNFCNADGCYRPPNTVVYAHVVFFKGSVAPYPLCSHCRDILARTTQPYWVVTRETSLEEYIVEVMELRFRGKGA